MTFPAPAGPARLWPQGLPIAPFTVPAASADDIPEISGHLLGPKLARTAIAAGEPVAAIGIGNQNIIRADVITAGSPAVRADVEEALALRVLVAPLPQVPALANVKLSGPKLRVDLAAGEPIATESFPAFKISAAPAAGEPTLVLDPREPAMRVIIGTESPLIRAQLLAIRLLPLALAAGEPTARANIKLRSIDLALQAGRPSLFVQFPGGPREAVFRFLPDQTVERRRSTVINLPRVFNETEAGRYVVTGLPAGLTYDAAAHQITGVATADAGSYNVRVQYFDR